MNVKTVFAIFLIVSLAIPVMAEDINNMNLGINPTHGQLKITPAEHPIQEHNVCHQLRVFNLVRNNHVQSADIIHVKPAE